MDPLQTRECTLVGIGLGGISEGWLYSALLMHHTGVLPFEHVMLIDGKKFQTHNSQRQLAKKDTYKAQERVETWSRIFPAGDVPFLFQNMFVTSDNIGRIVINGSVVMLAPDNHATRKLVSDHAETLDDILLITGGNDDIDKEAGTEGTDAHVIVHYKRQGRNLTPPITKHHEAIRRPKDESPALQGCTELVQAGQPQVLATNLLAGQLMILMLHRYCTLEAHKAARVVEVWGNSRTMEIAAYGLDLRPV